MEQKNGHKRKILTPQIKRGTLRERERTSLYIQNLLEIIQFFSSQIFMASPIIHVTVLKFFICPKSIKFETLIICKITSSKCLRMHYFNTIFEKFPGPPQINSSLRSSVRCFAPLFSVNFTLKKWGWQVCNSHFFFIILC